MIYGKIIKTPSSVKIDVDKQPANFQMECKELQFRVQQIITSIYNVSIQLSDLIRYHTNKNLKGDLN